MTKWERLRRHYRDRVTRIEELAAAKGVANFRDNPQYRSAESILNVMEYLDICEEAGDLEEAEAK